MKEQGPRPEPTDPILHLQKSLILDLMIAIPIIRQQQTVSPEVLAHGRKLMDGVREVSESQAFSMGRLIVSAISLLDGEKG